MGASGGVYSLLAGHLANLVLNYSSMQCGALRLVAILAIASVEVGIVFIFHKLHLVINITFVEV